MSAAIVVHELTKKFGAQRAVDALSFDVASGERLFVVGPSGCGKTTLLRLIAGLERPDGGEIRLFDQPVAGPHVMVPAAARRISLVFQSFALWPHMTVSEHLRYAGGRSAPREWIAQVTSMTRLGGLEPKYPAMLSGGEQQRLALARALVTRPRLLLLDEPLRNIDPMLAQDLRREMDALFRALAMTVIYVTHDQREALELGDRMLLMRAGRAEALGPPLALKREPPTLFAARFLGHWNVFELPVGERGVVAGPAGPLPSSLAAGCRALVSVEPRHVKLDRGGEGWRVNRVFAHADQTLVELEDQAQTVLVAALLNGAAVAAGDRVAVRIEQATVSKARGGEA